MVLQFTTARIITNYDNRLLQFTIGTLLQFTTTAVITFLDRYYNSRQVLLQFTTVLQFTTEQSWVNVVGKKILKKIKSKKKIKYSCQITHFYEIFQLPANPHSQLKADPQNTGQHFNI